MNNSKTEFLQNLVFDRQYFDKLIDYIELSTHQLVLHPYSHLVSVNSHQTDYEIKEDEIEDFLKNIYSYWYQFINEHSPIDKNSQMYEEVISARSDPKLTPEYIEKNGGYYKFFTEDFKNLFSSKELRAIKDQSFMCGGFLHIYNLIKDNKKTVRLYVNVKAENIIPLANEVARYCWQTNLPMHFKFAQFDNRNDPFLIYTSYQNAQKYVDLLKAIHQRSPQLFEGAKQQSPLLATVKDAQYIGFGEEPEKAKSSFNTERAILFKMVNDERNKAIHSLWDNNKHVIVDEKNLNMDQYLEYVIMQQLIKKTDEEIEKILSGKTKNALSPKEVAEFLKGQRELINLIKNGTYNKKIHLLAEEYKKQLEHEYDMKHPLTNDKTLRLVITTTNSFYAGQKPNNTNEYKWKILINGGDIDEALMKVSPGLKEKFIQNIHDPEVQKQYLDINHISTVYPYLNIETQRELDEEKNKSRAKRKKQDASVL